MSDLVHKTLKTEGPNLCDSTKRNTASVKWEDVNCARCLAIKESR